MSTLNPVVWTIPRGVKGNCYVFGLAPKIGKGGYYKYRMYKARPGDKCEKYSKAPFDFSRCSDLVKRVLCDNPKYVKKVNDSYMYKQIHHTQHLMAAILSPGVHKDFHFLRRICLKDVYENWDNLKYKTPRKAKQQLKELLPKYVWIHQRGWSRGGPIIHDASGNLIVNPSKADFNYKSLNYSIYCGLFKICTRKATVTTKYDF